MRRKRKDSIDLDDLKELSERSPAKYWVNLLLMHMCRDSVSSFTLQKSKGIPPIPGEEHMPPGGFDFDKIINRLKVMSDLDPVTFKEPRHGKIALLVHGTSYNVSTTFVDSVADSQCTIMVHPGKPQ
jgi:hypothetical protein